VDSGKSIYHHLAFYCGLFKDGNHKVMAMPSCLSKLFELKLVD